jgi:hypothetical protein
MWWFDGAGTWDINASIVDLNDNYKENSTETFSIGATTGFVSSPSSLTWAQINPGAINQEATNPITMNNTGNIARNIEINATNLLGESDNSKALYAENFSVNNAGGCGGTVMSHYIYTPVSAANLPKGNYTINDGTGQEDIYFCLEEASTTLTQQTYSTSEDGTWIIRIFAVIITTIKRKKKIKQDTLYKTIFILTEELKNKHELCQKEIIEIIEELKEKYKKQEITIPLEIFSKNMGCLESIVKYLKENLNLSYIEISKKLNRNQKTIWTAYKKSKEKENKKIIINLPSFNIPISKFNNQKFTVLETIILYLRNKNLKFSKIATILNRDQRNIWTINQRLGQKL